MFQPPPPSHSASDPDVISVDARQKWQGTRPGWRHWLITLLIIAVILALILIALFVIPE